MKIKKCRKIVYYLKTCFTGSSPVCSTGISPVFTGLIYFRVIFRVIFLFTTIQNIIKVIVYFVINRNSL